MLRGVPFAAIRADLDATLGELARCRIPTLIAAIAAPRCLGAFARSDRNDAAG